eukprot:6655529-Pyramimonas_sp.AAC.1
MDRVEAAKARRGTGQGKVRAHPSALPWLTYSGEATFASNVSTTLACPLVHAIYLFVFQHARAANLFSETSQTGGG